MPNKSLFLIDNNFDDFLASKSTKYKSAFLSIFFRDKQINLLPPSPKETVLYKQYGKSLFIEYSLHSPLNFWTQIFASSSVSSKVEKPLLSQ